MRPSSVSSPDSEARVDIPPTARCAGTAPPGLESAARRFGGNRTRAARLGLLLRPRWDLDTAAAAVGELVERLSLGGYPTQRHFIDARASGLYRAIAKRLGGHEAMAARLGLQLSHARRR